MSFILKTKRYRTYLNNLLNNLLKTSNTTITKATGRVKGNIDPNITHSSVSELKNLYNRELVSPHSNIYPIIPKIIHHIF